MPGRDRGITFEVESSGTGSEQVIAHNMGNTPSSVSVSTKEPLTTTVAYGVMDSINCRVTVESGIDFKLIAHS